MGRTPIRDGEVIQHRPVSHKGGACGPRWHIYCLDCDYARERLSDVDERREWLWHLNGSIANDSRPNPRP
jgi:hypothetical protein